jgi:hypothetical protein
LATYPRDLVNSCILTHAVTAYGVTQATTFTGRDLVLGDGRVNCLLDVAGINATAGTIAVEESTALAGTYTAITGASVSVTAAGVTGFSFDRNKQWVRAYGGVNGTAVTLSAVFVQQKKTTP